ncbi:DMT family transporter [Ktedonosporobacter rubrisoli]|uniref:DMT family transporter n=1 Tax=Ktedonosporobacter rubrisoli TaxID=2509675 RepID=A0A4P6JN20_KTERU|nr:DMT family transporter [Ktedonosporobacter rubrisoli]QBD76106.1 DMT family transporter [Ktedonosporobacter rubrisoli]
MGILFGLLAAVCFALADFVVTHATRHVGVLQALFAIQLFGVLVVGAVLIIMQAPPPGSLAVWALMGGISLINFVGTLLLYRAFAIGTLSLVSPIASGFAVVTAVLALASGERPPILTLVGTSALIVGVIVVARARGVAGASSLAGLPEALGASICLGIYFWALNRITPTLGAIWPVWTTRLVQLLCAFPILSIRGPFMLRKTWQAAPLLLLAAIFDSGALLAFNLGIGQTYTTIATALTSLYSAVTVLLAWLFLRERLTIGQWMGVGAILLGVLMVSI